MNNSEFFEAVRLLGKEKNIPEDALLEGIQRAIVTAVKRDYNNKDIVFCEIDTDNKDFKKWLSDLVFNVTYNKAGQPYMGRSSQ